MRICVATLRFPSPSETFILNHVLALIDRGHEVRILTMYPGRKGTVHEAIDRRDLRQHIVPLQVPRVRHRPLLAPKAALNLSLDELAYAVDFTQFGMGVFTLASLFALRALKEWDEGDFDIIHVHFGTVAFALLCIRDILHAPLITSFHGYDLTAYGPLTGVFYRKLFRTGDQFIANSEYTAEQLRKLGCTSEELHVIPSLIDHDQVQPQPRKSILTDEPIRLLSVGRLVKQKGIQVALQSVRKLVDSTEIRVEYSIAGDGTYRDELEYMTSEMELQNYVTFLGWVKQKNVFRQYRQADIVVFPSILTERGRGEAQGLVIQEALAHGVPVVGSRVGGIPEGLDYGRAGLLVEPGNPDDLSNAILSLIREPNLARRLAQRGRRYVEREYSRERVASDLERVYRLTIAGSQKPDSLSPA